MRNIRDYIASEHPEASGQHLASPFNIVAERLTLADFTQDEIGRLYRQHTEATGQVFEDEAIARAWHWSEGQPWLVNALAYEIVSRRLQDDHAVAVTGELVDQAAKELIRRGDTHIDSLLERLTEPRIRRVLDPIIVGDENWGGTDVISNGDLRYAVELGLIRTDGAIDDLTSPIHYARPANPIYADVFLRALARSCQTKVPKKFAKRWMDGERIDMTGLIKAFQQFWRENADTLGRPHDYDEAAPHLVFLAFLQRVINGGAELVLREYALGRERADIVAKYKGRSYMAELKIKDAKRPWRRGPALRQALSYLDKLGAEEGWLLIFDKSEISWDEKIKWETQEIKGKTIHLAWC
jgi:hypothetical protein